MVYNFIYILLQFQSNLEILVKQKPRASIFNFSCPTPSPHGKLPLIHTLSKENQKKMIATSQFHALPWPYYCISFGICLFGGGDWGVSQPIYQHYYQYDLISTHFNAYNNNFKLIIVIHMQYPYIDQDHTLFT